MVVKKVAQQTEIGIQVSNQKQAFMIKEKLVSFYDE
jgi:hypothetical protein